MIVPDKGGRDDRALPIITNTLFYFNPVKRPASDTPTGYDQGDKNIIRYSKNFISESSS